MERIAVCVCTCGRPAMLDEALTALARAELPPRPGTAVSLIVVDNRPDGSARAVCERRRPDLPVELHYVEEGQAGIPFARNRAVAAGLALGADHIAFLDDDDQPQAGWLAELLAAQAASGADLVFGTWAWPADHAVGGPLGRLRHFEAPRLENRNRYGLPSWAGTFNVLLGRRLLEALAAEGPVFRPEFALTGGSDMDLFIRANRPGFTHAIAPGSTVTRGWEAERFTLRGVMARAFTRGGSSWRLAESHLPAARRRRMRRNAVTSLLGAGVRLPLSLLGAERRAQDWVRLARAAGVINAALGGRFLYYGERRPARTPGPA